MAETPLVTVLMPVYNGQAYLPEAIDSILNQTFRDFEFLIIDDGSTDRSEEIIASYTDPRIRYERNPVNLNVAPTLNRGLDLARTKYVARMDADDISLPERLEKQVAFMENHPETGVCGTWVRRLSRRVRNWRTPLSDEGIRWYMVTNCALVATMLRKSVLDENDMRYREDVASEDYDLWVRLARYTKLANLPEILYCYRTHSDQKTLREAAQVEASIADIRLRQLRAMDIPLSEEEIAIHGAIFSRNYRYTDEFAAKAENWLRKLSEAVQDQLGPDSSDARLITLTCAKNLKRLCYQGTDHGWSAWRILWQSPLSQALELGLNQRLKFALKCALRWKRAL
jgi:glycosyltransferase involved in cell wall biosynthesis